MPSEIFIANLNFETSDHELRALFADFGEVKSARHIIDKATNRPRGFGFVTMATPEQAAGAIEALNEREYKKRNLVVRPAEARGERPAREHGGAKEAQNRRRYEGKDPRPKNNW